MKMVLIDGNTLEAREIDIEPSKIFETLEELNDGQRCGGVMYRVVAGKEYEFCYDDEFLYHGGNITGTCTQGPEIMMGSYIICADDEKVQFDDDDQNCGLRDMTPEETASVIAAWRPVAPETAAMLARTVHKDLMFLAGSNALQYELE